MLKDKECTQEHYDEMLGAVPPERMTHNAFLVGEPWDHAKDLSGHFGARYELYFIEAGKCYNGGLASTGDFDAFTHETEPLVSVNHMDADADEKLSKMTF